MRDRIVNKISKACNKDAAEKLVTNALAPVAIIGQSRAAQTPLQEAARQDQAVPPPVAPFLPMLPASQQQGLQVALLAFGPLPLPPPPNDVVRSMCLYDRTRTHSHILPRTIIHTFPCM